MPVSGDGVGSRISAEPCAYSSPMKEQRTPCLVPVPCGIQDGVLKTKYPILMRQTATSPLSYILFLFLFVGFFFVLFFLLYSSYIMRKINWIMLQRRQAGMAQLLTAVSIDLITSIY